ncbi:MAG: addiction module protein [Terrimicrobiaceae bacterium]
MFAELDVKALSKVEKLRLIETLWADLTGDASEITSPPWHQEALRETERLHAEGKASFSDWSEAKERIRAAVSGR